MTLSSRLSLYCACFQVHSHLLFATNVAGKLSNTELNISQNIPNFHLILIDRKELHPDKDEERVSAEPGLTFHPKFLKLTLLSLNLDTSNIANRKTAKIIKQNCKQSRS